MQIKTAVRIGQLRLKNPVMVASGTFGYAEEFEDFFDLRMLGAIVTKTITLKPHPGNPPPRTCETPAGMLNAIGLENCGIEVFLEKKLPYLKKIGVPIIVSISAKEKPEEFAELIKILDKVKEVSAVELNLSCPNVKRGIVEGGYLISQDRRRTHKLVALLRQKTNKTLIVKLSPNVTDIALIAKAVEAAGADAVSLVNTFSAMCIDVLSRQPLLSSTIGGLSGPAIRPIAVRMVWETYQKIKLPIIGMGGIIDISSALEFLIAGATAVALGTANFINPSLPPIIIKGIRRYLRDSGINNITKLIGCLKTQ